MGPELPQLRLELFALAALGGGCQFERANIFISLRNHIAPLNVVFLEKVAEAVELLPGNVGILGLATPRNAVITIGL